MWIELSLYGWLEVPLEGPRRSRAEGYSALRQVGGWGGAG